MDKVKDWLMTIICGLVTRPEEVKIVASQDEQGVLFLVSVAKEDTGKVLGRKGSIAQAVRVILRSAGYLEDMRASMKIDTPDSSFQLKDEDRA